MRLENTTKNLKVCSTHFSWYQVHIYIDRNKYWDRILQVMILVDCGRSYKIADLNNWRKVGGRSRICTSSEKWVLLALLIAPAQNKQRSDRSSTAIHIPNISRIQSAALFDKPCLWMARISMKRQMGMVFDLLSGLCTLLFPLIERHNQNKLKYEWSKEAKFLHLENCSCYFALWNLVRYNKNCRSINMIYMAKD
jgi:hypothetical protein